MQNRCLLPALRWLLYTLGAVLALTFQQSFFSRLPLGNAVPCLMPVAVALVAVMEGPELGGVFGLGVGLLWFWASARYGPMYIFLLPFSAVLAGRLCQSLFSRRFVPAVLMTAMVLLLCEGAVLLLQLFLGVGQPMVFLAEIGYSLCFVFPFYPIVRLISRVGGVKWNNATGSALL